MEILEEAAAGGRVLRLRGGIRDEEIPALDRALEARGAERVVVDLSGLETMNSQAISVFLVASRRARRVGGALTLAAARAAVREVLEVTRVAAFVPVAASVEEAFGGAASAAATERR